MVARRISPAEQAARVVALVIGAGLVVKIQGDAGDFTAGPYVRAVGPPGFAVFGYGREVPEAHRAQEMPRAIDAGRALVRCVGALRASQAAMATPGRPAFSTAGADAARRSASHVRDCRAFRCKTCGM